MNQLTITLLLGIIIITSTSFSEEWGFFGHRRINRMAVFTLPPEMIVFYKKNIEYITEHAVDPDKRRYATKHEAVRHYIDIDHWGTYPFPNVPRQWKDALVRYTDVYQITSSSDTIPLIQFKRFDASKDSIVIGSKWVSLKEYTSFFEEQILPLYYEDDWLINCESFAQNFPISGDCQGIYAVDRFSEFGILPYNLVRMQNRLTDAFIEKKPQKILRLSAEMGHYIGDAHVPLHTTTNYNGQLTDQVGIHAFWESRLPELFADRQYDFFVGNAEYIDKPNNYFWDIVLTSHQLVGEVLSIEKELSKTYPQDKQFCFENRLNSTIRTQCKEYAAAYHDKMQNMVEKRMQQAILAIGSSWYTAWVDAGKPSLKDLDKIDLTEAERKKLEKLEALYRQKNTKGRVHE